MLQIVRAPLSHSTLNAMPVDVVGSQGGERKVFVDVRVSARNPLLNGDKEEVASRQNFSTGQAEQEDGYAQNI